MKIIKNKFNSLWVSLLTFSLPLLASASTPAIPTGGSNVPDAPIKTVSGALGLICIFFGYMFYVLMTLAVIFIMIGAYRYLNSSGDGEKVKKANTTLLYAAIAVLVALLAKGIPLIVADFLNVTSGSLGAC
jgi:hypothetical protein